MSTGNKSKKSSDSKNINFNALIEAIKRCSLKKQSAKSAAKEYSIPRSTLQRYVKKVEEKFDDLEAVDDGRLLDFVRGCSQRVPSNQVFSTAQENDLVVYILKCANHYNGLSISELREFSYEYAKKLGVEFPDNWNEDQKAGIEWYKKFMRRHPKLCLRTPEQTSLNRAKAFCKAAVQEFLNQVVPLQGDTPKKPTNSSHKPEILADFKKKTAEREAKNVVTPAKRTKTPPAAIPSAKRAKTTPAKTSAKRARTKESLSSDEDEDFCILCLKLLPRILTATNSIKCTKCNRPVHLKCVKMHNSFWQCIHCKDDTE